MRYMLAVSCAVLLAQAHGDQVFPGPDWTDAPHPIASPDAVVGGEISIFAGQYPDSFNYYLDNNTFSAELFGAMYDTLLTRDPINLAEQPGLAERWSISDDKRTFTFWIDPRARWSDGTPITADDVYWTFEAVRDPANQTGPHKINVERFAPPEVLDERTIRFTAHEVHWQNLNALGGFIVLPKHAFADKDFNKINFEFPVVSGPYRLSEIKEGLYARLQRRDDWWNRDTERYQGVGNFELMKFKFYADRENAFEGFRNGEIDLFPIYTSRLWVNETGGEKFAKQWIVKQKVVNHGPIGFQGFAMNMRRAPFDDVRVRRAMAYLLDRDHLNRRLMYNQYFLHRSYFEDLYSADTPCPNEMFEFDKARARQLLAEAGWKANPETGLLEKDGHTFSIQFLTRDTSADKYLVKYREDLRDVGIELQILRKDWAAWKKDMDEFNFDMTWAAWSAGVFKDPESLWASKEADRKSGNNICGFKSERVDELIEKQKAIFDVEERHAIVREIDAILAEAVPYVLLWNINYTRLLYWNKFGTPDTVLDKYGSEQAAYWYWWLDPDSEADLEDAMRTGRALPRRPAEVIFDEEFMP